MAVNAPERPPADDHTKTATSLNASERPQLQVEDGVIHEARRRSRTRRIRTVLAVVLLLGGVGLLLAHLASSGAASKTLPGRGSALPAVTQDGSLQASLSPNLEPGRPGWCVSAAVHTVALGFGCAFLLTRSHPFLGEGWARAPGGRYVTSLVLTPARVRSILFNGHRVLTRKVRGVPFSLRVAVLERPVFVHSVPGSTRVTTVFVHSVRVSRPAPTLTTLGLARVLTVGGRRVIEGAETREAMPVRYWQQPEAPPHGPCELHASALSGLLDKWGGVVTAIRSTPGQVAGDGFLPCLDAGYMLNGHAIQAAVLLDASQPAHKLPGPIPGLLPIPQEPSFYNTAPSLGYLNPMTAKRQGNAWIVLAGGGRNAEEARIRLLRHLTASIPASP
jgi:hypothetical protein